ncbi:MAG TPA: DUF3592 domain-containing protein [Planctomycetota bacterium]|nr:DUF3592 domain-containing protein [Planctomycetota bacterium]
MNLPFIPSPKLIRTLRVAAVAAFVVALAWAGMRAAFLARASETDGTVVGMEVSRATKYASYRPIVAYRTTDGVSRTWTAAVGTSPPSYERGERVTVLYEPSDPGDAMIGDGLQLWFGPAFAAVVGLVLVGFAALLRRSARAASDG